MRKTILMNDNWTFEKEGIKEKISLPHTWNATDGQSKGDYYRGRCKYEKEFLRPATTKGSRIYLEFRGVNSSCDVEVNGTKVMSHDGGYSTFRTDVTDVLKEKNTLTVYADNSPNDRVYPQRADFTFYGGIYRDVYMVIVDEGHFDLDYYGGNGFLVTPHLNGKDATIELKTFTSKTVSKVEVELYDASKNLVGSVELSGADGEFSGSIEIKDVHRWNGIKDPYLYKAKALCFVDDKVTDEVSTRFGCREYSFDPEKGFFLNGESYPLHGVSRHQDRAGVGNALTKEMHEEDMNIILSVGANSIRLAHYQHDQYFYDLCDEKGIVAWAEIPYITVHMPTGRENTISQMKELITQNYNHASIICWALSNEITLQEVTDDLMENHKILNDLVHEMDPKRCSAMANLFLLDMDSPMVQLPDIRGYNLYYGWYVGEMEDNDAWFDEFHKKHPDMVIGLTEYGADSTIKLQSPLPKKGDFTEGYQALYHEHMLEMFSTRPYIWGTYVWNMFEFAAAGRDEAGDPGKNHKGLVTFDRKTYKDAYYIYKAWWTSDPFVHLCGRRYHDRIEDVTEIKVYGNVDAVAIYVDGEKKGIVEGNHVYKLEVPISGKHIINTFAVIDGIENKDISDKMEIEKVSEPNPAYFADAKSVKNWFDEEEPDFDTQEGCFSLNDTLGEVMQNPEAAKLWQDAQAALSAKTAGGVGDGVEIPDSMKAMLARQPLHKLVVQGGYDLEDENIVQLNARLNKIKKA